MLLTPLVSYIAVEVAQPRLVRSDVVLERKLNFDEDVFLSTSCSAGRVLVNQKGARKVSGSPNLKAGSTRPGQRMPNRSGNLLLELGKQGCKGGCAKLSSDAGHLESTSTASTANRKEKQCATGTGRGQLSSEVRDQVATCSAGEGFGVPKQLSGGTRLLISTPC
eukprot:3459840-Amphidinium_carterae.1